MKKMSLSFVTAVLALTLTGCGGEEDLVPEGLRPADQAPEATEVPREELPEAPVNTLEEDLTTPEGTMTAYMTYLNLGDGDKVCSLFLPPVVNAYGGARSCPGGVTDYAEAVLPEFEDSLDVASAVKVRVNSKTGTRAEGSAAVIVNEAENTAYYEGFVLQKQNNEWRIANLKSLDAQETTN